MGIVKQDSIKNSMIAYAGIAIGYLNKLLLFTNFLTTEQVGLSNLIVTIAALFASLSGFGIVTATLKYFPFFRDDQNKHNGFLFWSVLYAFAGFVLFTAVFLLFRQPITGLYEKNSSLLTEYYFYLIPLGLATLMFNLFESYLKSLFQSVFTTFVKEILLRLLVTLSVSLFAFGLVNFHSFVIIYILANSLPAVILMLYAYGTGQLYFRPVVSTFLITEYKSIITFSLYSFLNNISAYLLLIIDSLMIAAMVGLGATGIYTTMAYITSVFLIPSRSMSNITVPLVSYHWKHHHMDEMKSLYQKVAVNNLIIGGLIFLLIWVNLDFLFQFIPADYEAGVYVFFFLALGKLFDIYCGINGAILSLSRKYRWDLYFSFFLIALTAGTNYLLIPLYGIVGAAIATAITLVLYNTIRVVFVLRYFHIHPFRGKDVLVFVAGIVSIAATWQLEPAGNMYVGVLIRSVVSGSLFIVPLLLFRVSPDLNGLLLKIAKRFRG